MKPNGNSPVSDSSSSTRWAPILGHWSVGEDQIAYKGGDERFVAHGQEFPIGILVNNRELLSGACRVDVEFENISNGHFAGGIILNGPPQPPPMEPPCRAWPRAYPCC